jgi:hypothetical protein
MANRIPSASQPASLLDLANYNRDAEASLRLYFTSTNPDFIALFAGDRPSEVAKKLADRIHETDMRSALVVMAHVEAAFRLDYDWRRKAKKPDAVSIAFRRHRRTNVRLDEDIWETWKVNHPTARPLVSQLRSAFNFRHWLAHGRYGPAGQKYDFQTLYILAQAVLTAFPLCS